jgi:hypothetical protein
MWTFRFQFAVAWFRQMFLSMLLLMQICVFKFMPHPSTQNHYERILWVWLCT